MQSADEFDGLDDDDLLSAAVNCQNCDDDDAFANSPRPKKRRRVSQDVSSIRSILTISQLNAKSVTSRTSRPTTATDHSARNRSNGDALNSLPLDLRVTSATKAHFDGKSDKRLNSNRSGTRQYAKSTSRSDNVIAT